MKRCSKCGVEKDESEFNRDGRRLTAHCKVCLKAYRKANREKIAATQKAYLEANREKVAATKKAYLEANREKVKARNRAWAKANPEKAEANSKVRTVSLSDAYVRQQLQIKGPVPAELIEAKREQLKIHRAVKQLQEVLKDAAQPKQENDHE